MTKLEVITDMLAASHHLSIGLAGLLHKVLPEEEGYKVEVLLETYTDALKSLSLEIERGEKK